MYVEEVKARGSSDIPPIPVMKPYEAFYYSAADYRDPFTPTVIDEPQTAPEVIDNGIKPDKNRRKEPLESYSLAELQFVGTLKQEILWGLIRSSEGIIHKVKKGNYMGNNHGLILELTESQIKLKEIVPRTQGGYEERETSVAVVEVN